MLWLLLKLVSQMSKFDAIQTGINLYAEHMKD